MYLGEMDIGDGYSEVEKTSLGTTGSECMKEIRVVSDKKKIKVQGACVSPA